jgi:hypothetical protein
MQTPFAVLPLFTILYTYQRCNAQRKENITSHSSY